MRKINYSVLDLAYVREGDTLNQTFKNTLDNAKFVDEIGYSRYWLSEHHNMQNVASAATSLLIGYVANGTSRIKVGSGGIMLPNHTALSVAEQFGTLDALYPNRIDLGLGRAPGTDQLTASILRRGDNFMNYDFEAEIKNLQNYFSLDNKESKVRAIPGEGANVPIYILGSSTDSAFLAAKLGLPYAFAGHFAPQQFYNAVEIYRSQFQPSEFLQEPYTIACVNVIAANTDEEAHYLSMSMYQGFLNIITDKRQPIVPPEKTQLELASPEQKYMLKGMTALSFIGSKGALAQSFDEFIFESKIDEIMVSTNVFDQKAKRKSYQIVSELFR
ncbi:LLM class flavin-dependent oxidoreductase [Empedobacter falsenii]|uniref:LLM class flavin-dependent oxidoreductase n=1 Tax=Empedobacter TaxID=59734 RepID=UPI002577A25C|nr:MULTISPECIES: LLM class flavin-dependent oxidoreductase [Empedobacter]MDM1041885.1 LLM class flavin-dependent oxidoreductase [Empedobacter brevis]MDM1135816.1 LLM class flavin-dependent oxidoreductase [Empedobacter sp. R750]MDM1297002.1 LLM class flavin-dependent oxidoreductase [Empedobacter falsenii]MDM1316795.1 LLM class flavin-dependent oxidoreductase [Empedobacter falsenii]